MSMVRTGSERDLVREIQRKYGIPESAARRMYEEAAQRAIDQQNYRKEVERAQRLTYGQWLETERSNPDLRWDFPWIKHVVQYVEATVRGDISQLIINIPPRLGKSELITKRLPVYWMERNPKDGIIVAGYGSGLAEKFAADSLKIYRERNPAKVDSEAREEWTNIYGGFVRPVGVGSGVTGRGCECFPRETLVLTESGFIDILTLVRLQYKPMVYAWDHASNRIVLRKILATREKVSNDLYRITTASGKSIRATGSHYFYSLQRGYTQAKYLRPGERVLSARDLPHVQSGEATGEQAVQRVPHVAEAGWDGDNASMQPLSNQLYEEAVRLQQSNSEGPQGFLLFGAMLGRPSFSQECQALQALWQSNRQSPWSLFLFGEMPKRQKSPDAYLPNLWRSVSGQELPFGLLWPSLRKRGPLGTDEGQGESTLSIGNELCQTFSRDERVCPGTGQSPMLWVWGAGRDVRDSVERHGHQANQSYHSPYRRTALEQQSWQPGDPVQDLPCNSSQVQEDTISMVEYVGGTDERVYDLQVEGCHNFFAQSILVHNCLIIDDPVKNIKEALSAAYQKGVWDWWIHDLRTRRNRQSRTPTILIMTRWADDDLTGKIMQSPDYKDWEHVVIPALSMTQEERDQEAERAGWPLGLPDPLGRVPGISIEEERLPLEELLKLQGDDFSFKSLYQQLPIQSALASIKAENLKFIEEIDYDGHRIRYWDQAASAGKGDWTVGVLACYTNDGRFVIEDVVRGQWGEDEVEQKMRQTALSDHALYGGRDKYVMRQVVEREPASSGKRVANYMLSHVLAGVDAEEERPTDNKDARIRPFSAAVNRGDIEVLRGDWNRAFVNELRVYVIGLKSRTDDQVDAAAGVYNKLTIEFTVVGVS